MTYAMHCRRADRLSVKDSGLCEESFVIMSEDPAQVLRVLCNANDGKAAAAVQHSHML